MYPDPVTGKADWGIVRAPDGGVMGVYSLSPDTPLKRGNFQLRDQAFEHADKYSAWRFVYDSNAKQMGTPNQ